VLQLLQNEDQIAGLVPRLLISLANELDLFT
jgi:hypothetical protein